MELQFKVVYQPEQIFQKVCLFYLDVVGNDAMPVCFSILLEVYWGLSDTFINSSSNSFD